VALAGTESTEATLHRSTRDQAGLAGSVRPGEAAVAIDRISFPCVCAAGAGALPVRVRSQRGLLHTLRSTCRNASHAVRDLVARGRQAGWWQPMHACRCTCAAPSAAAVLLCRFCAGRCAWSGWSLLAFVVSVESRVVDGDSSRPDSRGACALTSAPRSPAIGFFFRGNNLLHNPHTHGPTTTKQLQRANFTKSGRRKVFLRARVDLQRAHRCGR
jgi:hypothetical protein